MLNCGKMDFWKLAFEEQIGLSQDDGLAAVWIVVGRLCRDHGRGAGGGLQDCVWKPQIRAWEAGEEIPQDTSELRALGTWRVGKGRTWPQNSGQELSGG